MKRFICAASPLFNPNFVDLVSQVFPRTAEKNKTLFRTFLGGGASRYYRHPAGGGLLPLLPQRRRGRGRGGHYFIECFSPQPSPHSFLAGRGRKFLVVVSMRPARHATNLNSKT